MQKYNPDIHKRRSMRLNGYDYSQEGLYFITICCVDKLHFLGEIIDGQMMMNEIGKIAEQCWLDIPNHFQNVVLHNFVIMPNHLHGIIEITFNANYQENLTVGEKYFSPNSRANSNSPQQSIKKVNGTSKTVGSIVRGFKIGVTKWVRNNTDIYDIWQRNYHDHIIRNEQSYLHIAEYIQNNPLQWELDCFYS